MGLAASTLSTPYVGSQVLMQYRNTGIHIHVYTGVNTHTHVIQYNIVCICMHVYLNYTHMSTHTYRQGCAATGGSC